MLETPPNALIIILDFKNNFIKYYFCNFYLLKLLYYFIKYYYNFLKANFWVQKTQ